MLLCERMTVMNDATGNLWCDLGW